MDNRIAYCFGAGIFLLAAVSAPGSQERSSPSTTEGPTTVTGREATTQEADQHTGTTVYITKNKGTSANLFTDWEVHGPRQGTNSTSKTPGQAFTDEWGLGQVLPLKKDFSQLLQLGVIGYDQWQVTANGGTFAVTGPLGNTIILSASSLPYYSVHPWEAN